MGVHCAPKDVQGFDGLKTCHKCREAKRKCDGKNKSEHIQARREERAKGNQICEDCGHRIRHEKLDADCHSAFHPNSELHVLMKGDLAKFDNLRKEGKLNDKLQAEMKAAYEKQKREASKRLNEQLPSKPVDEDEMREPQPKPEKPNPIFTQCLLTSISC